MQVSEYCQQDTHSLAELIKTKVLSPREALDCALARLHEVNPALNAVVTECVDWGLEQLNSMRGDEPFYGVPILVKDLGFMLKGVPYTAGSRFYSSMKSPINSDSINRLVALGFVPFAKTNVPELGLSYVTESVLHGPCRNPYDLERTTGGSSGGSAAAVATGVVPLATATDGGGSIRIPAACCGLFGFKPSPGLMSTGPWVSEAWSGLAAGHVLTRTVRDSALLFELFSVRTVKEVKERLDRFYKKPRQRPQSLKVVQLEGAFASVPVDPAYLEAVERTKKILTKLGHKVSHHKLDLDLNGIGEAARTIIAANVCAEIEHQESLLGRKAKSEELESITWEFMKEGKPIKASQLIAAKNSMFQLLQPLHELLLSVDLILTPALAKLPLIIGSLPTDDDLESYMQKNVEFSPFTSLFNQAGLPAMTMPMMFHDSLPISVQFAAAKGEDDLLLDLAWQLESEFPDFTKPLMKLGIG